LKADMPGQAERIAAEAVEHSMAKPVERGLKDLVLLPSHLGLTIHEIVAHATELDRIAGYEANYAGTSFVKISDLNMARPAQVEEFNRRVERASDRICASYVDPRQLTATAACAQAVHDEANAKLNQRQSALSSMTMANR